MAGYPCNNIGCNTNYDGECQWPAACYKDHKSELTINACELKIGEPCGHPGCLNHRTHPCEGCGRIGGREI